MGTIKRKASTKITVILPDVHLQARSKDGIAPMDRHDPAAISVAFQIIQDIKPDTVIQLGDLLHLGYISGFQRKKDMLGKAPSEDGETINLTVGRDMELGNIFWDHLQKVAKGADDFHQLEGNHEEILRVARNMSLYSPYVDNQWYPEKALNLQDRGVKWTPYQRYGGSKNWVEVGKLWVIHGQYASANHAKKHHDAWGHSLAYGHLHTYESHSFQSVDSLNGTWCLGCLCTPTASYHRGRNNAWREGVGIVYTLPNGKFNVYFVDIIKGQAVWNGKLYTSKRLPGLM